ncbi:MAG: pyrimidine reductase [Anaerolineales bacterium]|nr:MAG: pyrimidine reductase [Anaerolineales bacterium]
MDNLLQLYPRSGLEHGLEGLYLQQQLRAQPGAETTAFVYANFVTSLDGRIAVPHADLGLSVPEAITNPRDWRLFQELAVQADILLSSGRYLREYAAGRAQDILRVYDDPELADLAGWRQSRALPLHPAIAVISASLDFPIPRTLIEGDRKVVILTTQSAPLERKRALEAMGLQVLIAGDKRVEGGSMVSALQEQGYRLIYSAAGPKVLHLLLEAGVLNRLYLTFAARILGGTPFASILEGQLLSTPAEFILRHLYLDPQAPGEGGQLFAAYDYRARI